MNSNYIIRGEKKEEYEEGEEEEKREKQLYNLSTRHHKIPHNQEINLVKYFRNPA